MENLVKKLEEQAYFLLEKYLMLLVI